MITTNHIIIYFQIKSSFQGQSEQLDTQKKKKKRNEKKEREKKLLKQQELIIVCILWTSTHKKSKLRTKIEQSTSLHTLPVGDGVRTGTEQIPKQKKGAEIKRHDTDTQPASRLQFCFLEQGGEKGVKPLKSPKLERLDCSILLSVVRLQSRSQSPRYLCPVKQATRTLSLDEGNADSGNEIGQTTGQTGFPSTSIRFQ